MKPPYTKRPIRRQIEVKEAFGGQRRALEPTDGLVPMRRRRVLDDGRLEGKLEVAAWAKEQPWYPRVVFFRFDMRWWIWWLKPEEKETAR